MSKKMMLPPPGRFMEKYWADTLIFRPRKNVVAILCAESSDDDPQAYEFAAKARAAFPDDPEVAKGVWDHFVSARRTMRARRHCCKE
jgi:hypothetical protein